MASPASCCRSPSSLLVVLVMALIIGVCSILRLLLCELLLSVVSSPRCECDPACSLYTNSTTQRPGLGCDARSCSPSSSSQLPPLSSPSPACREPTHTRSHGPMLTLPPSLSLRRANHHPTCNKNMLSSLRTPSPHLHRSRVSKPSRNGASMRTSPSATLALLTTMATRCTRVRAGRSSIWYGRGSTRLTCS